MSHPVQTRPPGPDGFELVAERACPAPNAPASSKGFLALGNGKVADYWSKLFSELFPKRPTGRLTQNVGRERQLAEVHAFGETDHLDGV